MEERPTVLFVNGKPNGCDWYRLRQPAIKLMESRLFPCALSTELPPDDLELALSKSDVVVTQHFSEKLLDWALNERAPHQKFVFDYDDNIFEVSPYNPAYEQHGVSEVKVTMADDTGVKLWEDGKNKFDLKRNRSKIFMFAETLKAADLVTTPSSVLSGVFKQHGAKKTKVIKNFIDLNLWKPVRLVPDGIVRIGYQGGWSHYEDWLEIQGAIATVMAKYPQVELVIMGQTYPGALKDLPANRVHSEWWVPIDAYPYKFKTLGIDIGIAPLANNAFNICKSEIKWEEYSALGIPTIASNIPPYSLAISHGKTGFLASNEAEWVEYLTELILYAARRRELGQAARAKIVESYDIDKRYKDYVEIYKGLFQKELIVV